MAVLPTPDIDQAPGDGRGGGHISARFERPAFCAAGGVQGIEDPWRPVPAASAVAPVAPHIHHASGDGRGRVHLIGGVELPRQLADGPAARVRVYAGVRRVGAKHGRRSRHLRSGAGILGARSARGHGKGEHDQQRGQAYVSETDQVADMPMLHRTPRDPCCLRPFSPAYHPARSAGCSNTVQQGPPQAPICSPPEIW